MRYIDWSDVFMTTLGFLMVILVFFAVFFWIPESIEREKRLMAECMKDHKEYECQAMLNGGDTTLIVPIVAR